MTKMIDAKDIYIKSILKAFRDGFMSKEEASTCIQLDYVPKELLGKVKVRIKLFQFNRN